MNILKLFQKQPEAPAPARLPHHPRRSYMAAQTSNLVAGWTAAPVHIDSILRQNLRTLRARARYQARNDDYAKRFLGVLKNNVIGHTGITMQAQVTRLGNPDQLDEPANSAIEKAWADWCIGQCDLQGQLSFVDMQNLMLTSCATDGEFMAITHRGAQYGKYGFQLELVDAELLDTNYNRKARNGNDVRMGIEYNSAGQKVNYHFKTVDWTTGQYSDGEWRIIPAKRVIHLFITESIGQNRGVPWLSTPLFRMKMLSGYEDAAITAARIGASKMGFYTSPDGTGYTGDDVDEQGNLISEAEAGMFEQLPDGVAFQEFNPAYPHEQFGDFMKSCLRGISSGLGVSYHTLANDLEGVNYTSSRTGALEDRENWKALQTWVINGAVRQIYETFIESAVLNHAITIGNKPLAGLPGEYKAARYQGKRWDWVDPLKDTNADNNAISTNTMSVSEVIRKRGRDPDEVFQEIADEKKKMEVLGITPADVINNSAEVNSDDEA